MKQSLSERMSARQKEIETQSVDSLKKLNESLRTALQADMETTLSVIRAQQKILKKSLSPVLWIATLCLAIVLAAVGLLLAGTLWANGNLSDLRDQVKAEKAALAEIEKATGGLRILRDPKGVFVVLPSTATSKFWTCENGQTCVKIGD